MDRLRIPLFVAACACLVLTILLELASVVVMPARDPGLPTPGWGIRYLALIDVLPAYILAMMALDLVMDRSAKGRLQGVLGMVLSLFGLLAAIAMIFFALQLLAMMVALLLTVPFGTAAYFAVFAGFPRGEAAATLSIIMVLKLAFCVLLLFAHQRFLQMKGLLVLCGLSLGATWLVGFLHGFVPGFLASISDVVAALVVAILGAIWMVLFLVGSVQAIYFTARST